MPKIYNFVDVVEIALHHLKQKTNVYMLFNIICLQLHTDWFVCIIPLKKQPFWLFFDVLNVANFTFSMMAMPLNKFVCEHSKFGRSITLQ